MRTVLVLAGTDHHPFDRLIDWVDIEARRRPEVRFVVQHGATKAPSVAAGTPYIASVRLAALTREAAAVVCHGGPGSIMDARASGHVPVCVPRDPDLGEHVDPHQQRFARVSADAGIVRVAFTLDEFTRALDEALAAGPSSVETGSESESDGVPDSLARLSSELDLLLRSRPPARRAWFLPLGRRSS